MRRYDAFWERSLIMSSDPRDPELQAKLEAWAVDSNAQVRPELTQRVRDNLKQSLSPVAPLPSKRTLFLVFVGLFLGGVLSLIALMGKAGLYLMAPAQVAGISAVLLGLGIL